MTRISSQDALLDAAIKSPSVAGFAMFELDMGGAVDPQSGELLCPSLGGKHTPLWNITSNTGIETTRQRDHYRAMADDAEVAHRERWQAYAKRVEAGEALFEGDDTPTDEWDHFWGNERPTQTGYVKRAHLNQ